MTSRHEQPRAACEQSRTVPNLSLEPRGEQSRTVHGQAFAVREKQHPASTMQTRANLVASWHRSIQRGHHAHGPRFFKRWPVWRRVNGRGEVVVIYLDMFNTVRMPKGHTQGPARRLQRLLLNVSAI